MGMLRGREADVVSSLQALEDECIHTWPEGDGVALCKRMFTNMLFCCVYCSIISYPHTKFQFITCPINQLCAQIGSYYNVWPGAVYCCFNKNYKVYNILNMTLHALLVNPTCLQSFIV